MNSKTLIKIENLKVAFNHHKAPKIVIHDVSFSVFEGKTLCLVGESGCGKSVSTLAIMGLLGKSGQIISGTINFEGSLISNLSQKDMSQLRGNDIAMIFQEPMTALNPVMRIGTQLTECLTRHRKTSPEQAKSSALDMLLQVGILDAQRVFNAFPFMLSGGMRQRVMIAMALLCEPKLLIADEPTTALDVTIQAQILKLIQRQKERLGMGLLLVTHNFGVVAEMADEVAVMYAGEIVEHASVMEIFEHPRHPYTKKLMAAMPHLNDSPDRRLEAIPGQVPPAGTTTLGCRFADRCSQVTERCHLQAPSLKPLVSEQTHLVRCWLEHQIPDSLQDGGHYYEG